MFAQGNNPDEAPSLDRYDASQTSTLGDLLTLVDSADVEVGVLDKKTCHLNSYNRNGGRPHRAFSLFLFNHKNELLLQRRSPLKIAFPDAWTNSVCSHPEVREKSAGQYQYEEPADAAVRRARFEIGVDISKFKPYLVGKLLYRSEYDQNWGEHELDHVFVCRVDQAVQDSICLNPDEVAAVQWVSRGDLPQLMDKIRQGNGYFSPWFEKIHKTKLLDWWSVLETKGQESLAQFKVPATCEYI